MFKINKSELTKACGQAQIKLKFCKVPEHNLYFWHKDVVIFVVLKIGELWVFKKRAILKAYKRDEDIKSKGEKLK